MRSHDLLDIIGEADDRYIQDAGKERHRLRLNLPGLRSLAAAACVALVVFGGLQLLQRKGGDGANSGSGGGDGLTYMSYAGPVFPLTVQDGGDGLTAAREIEFDFLPYISTDKRTYEFGGKTVVSQRYDDEVIVTDRYTLTNETGADKTVTLLYPFAGNLGQTENSPAVSVDGQATETTIHPGEYAGEFMGVLGGKNQEYGSENLRHFDDFADYEVLLSDGSYQTAAFDAYPELNQMAYVYRMSDYVYTTDAKATNPTLSMEFYIDYSKTTVLTYGINGASWDTETGYRSCRNSAVEVRPLASEENRYPDDAFVILLGEDIDGYTIQGYRDGGCDAGEEVDDLGCTITRYETTLGEFLLWCIRENYSDTDGQMLYDLTAELLCTHGPLSDSPKARYDSGMLGSMIIEAKQYNRVMYLAFEVSIPAGSSVTVEAVCRKEASMDYTGKDKDRDGYDMATTLGSSLTFMSQSASISNWEEITILDQNFGFDPENGVTRVELDMSVPNYWIQVKKVLYSQAESG